MVPEEEFPASLINNVLPSPSCLSLPLTNSRSATLSTELKLIASIDLVNPPVSPMLPYSRAVPPYIPSALAPTT